MRSAGKIAVLTILPQIPAFCCALVLSLSDSGSDWFSKSYILIPFAFACAAILLWCSILGLINMIPSRRRTDREMAWTQTDVWHVLFGVSLPLGFLFIAPAMQPTAMPMASIASVVPVACAIAFSRCLSFKQYVHTHVFCIWFCLFLNVLSSLHLQSMQVNTLSIVPMMVTMVGMLLLVGVLLISESFARSARKEHSLVIGLLIGMITLALIIAAVRPTLFALIPQLVVIPIFWIFFTCFLIIMVLSFLFLTHGSTSALLVGYSTIPFYYQLITSSYFSVFSLVFFISVFICQLLSLALYLALPDNVGDAFLPYTDNINEDFSVRIAGSPHDIIEEAGLVKRENAPMDLAVCEFSPADMALMQMCNINKTNAVTYAAQFIITRKEHPPIEMVPVE